MKVIINNAEMVPTPKKGTIIRFGDWTQYRDRTWSFVSKSRH